MPESIATPTSPPRRPWLRRAARGLIVVALIMAAGSILAHWWLRELFEVYTENAYVVGNLTPIAAEVGGSVVVLYVDDNMPIEAGSPVAQLDPVPYQLLADEARADLARARADLQAAEDQVRLIRKDRQSLLAGSKATLAAAEQAVKAAEVEIQARTAAHHREEQQLEALRARVPGAEAVVKNTQELFDRFSRLAASGDVTVQERDNREAAYREAAARLASLQKDIAAAVAAVAHSEQQVREAMVRLELARKTMAASAGALGQSEAAQIQPDIATAEADARRRRVEQARVRYEHAVLNLSNTLIRAPRAGIVSRRTIQLGQTVLPRQPFLTLTPLDLDNVWVVANLREEQMRRVRVGMAASVTLDSNPETVYPGWVESVAGGTGSVFSLFPPDNATGNFTRVVQRLPVRIRFAMPANDGDLIRPGLSCKVRIDIHHFVRKGEQPW